MHVTLFSSYKYFVSLIPSSSLHYSLSPPLSSPLLLSLPSLLPDVQNDDFDMMKPPIPDDSQTPHHYHPQQFFSGDNGGMAIHGSMMQGMHTQIPIGSSMGLQQHHQPRFDDFASDDEKFV